MNENKDKTKMEYEKAWVEVIDLSGETEFFADSSGNNRCDQGDYNSSVD